MTSITQQIPNYTGGVSQQPDELKLPGQVNKAKNVLPDVTLGLLKRPGGQLIGSGLTVDSGNLKWFHYYRDEAEQYIGQISRSGEIKMWRCSDGTEVTVTDDIPYTDGTYTRTDTGVVTVTIAWPTTIHNFRLGDTVVADFTSGGGTDGTYTITEIVDNNTFKFNDGGSSAITDQSNVRIKRKYLVHTSDSDIQTLTSNDTTFLLNRNVPVAMSSTTTAAKPPEAFIELKKVAYANQYSVNLFDNTELTTTTTATRIKVSDEKLGSDAYCTNVDTKIFNLSSSDTGKYHIKRFSDIARGSDGSVNFLDTDTERTYTLLSGSTSVETSDATGNISNIINGWIEHANYSSLDVVFNPIKNGGTGTNTFDVIYKTQGNKTSNTLTLTRSGTTSSTYTPTATNHVTGEAATTGTKKDLYFRLTTTGQSIPESGTTEPSYTCRYTTTIDLLNGGSGWAKDNVLQVLMKGGIYTINVDEISTAKIQANLSLARPEPTPFDTKTVITPESVLGNLRTAIFEGGDQMRDEPSHHYDYIEQIGNGLYVARNTQSCFRHIYTYGDGNSVGSDNKTFNLSNFQLPITKSFSSGNNDESEVRVYFYDSSEPIYKWHGTFMPLHYDANGQLISGQSENFNGPWKEFTLNHTTGQIVLDTALESGDKIEIFQTNPSLFNISTPSSELLNVITSKVDDVGDLPKQCKHGYVIEVANSEADEDNYYVKFFGNNDKDGDGVWEECPKPSITTTIDPGTMPLKLVRQSDGNFKLSQITWDARGVGDEITAPEPSFVTGTDGDRKINNMMFFRNRLVFFSDENVIMSRPGEFYNFWPKSAITYSAEDPIDLSASSDLPAIIYDGIQVNSGLILFSENQQFMLSTESEVLSPVTAKINSLTTYNFNSKSNPFSLGATIGFLDNAGKYSRFFEMVNVLREGEPTVLEQSKIVSQYLPKEVDIIANSRENSVIFFAVKGQTKLYGYRYHTASSKRILQSWFEWELSGAIQHLAMLDDALYAIVKNSTTHTIQKFRFKHEIPGHLTYDIDYLSKVDPVNLHLDQAKLLIIAPSGTNTIQVTYNATTNKTSFTKPAEFVTTSNLAVMGVDGHGDSAERDVGRFSLATINGSNVEIDGDWTPASNSSIHYIYLGYLYEMEVEFPTIYRQETSGTTTRSDTSSSLVLHRVNLSFGGVGLYNTTLTRVGKLPYQETYESTPADAYKADTAALLTEVIKTIPVYEKNTNLTLTLKSTHPSPATLYSMSWEGDYSPKYYRRV